MCSENKIHDTLRAKHEKQGLPESLSVRKCEHGADVGGTVGAAGIRTGESGAVVTV